MVLNYPLIFTYVLKLSSTILFTAFYLLGTFILPFGDFSVIKDLPGMFNHCKATEDTDLNVFEFLTEHVSGLGQLIEGNEHGEEEGEENDKPHAPVQIHFEQQKVICESQAVTAPAAKPLPLPELRALPTGIAYIADYVSAIFRPPIV